MFVGNRSNTECWGCDPELVHGLAPVSASTPLTPSQPWPRASSRHLPAGNGAGCVCKSHPLKVRVLGTALLFPGPQPLCCVWGSSGTLGAGPRALVAPALALVPCWASGRAMVQGCSGAPLHLLCSVFFGEEAVTLFLLLREMHLEPNEGSKV